MKYLFLLFSCSLVLIQCKRPFEFKNQYYLVESESAFPIYAITLDSLGYFVLIGSGYDSAYLAEVSCDSINFCLPCLECRHSYTRDNDTMFIHSPYGVYKLSPLASISQEILFANELVKLEIESGKGKTKSLTNELRCEIKIGHSLRDSVDRFELQINDNIIEFYELEEFKSEILSYHEIVSLSLFFHKDYSSHERERFILELNGHEKLELYQAYFDTTSVNFISYDKLN